MKPLLRVGISGLGVGIDHGLRLEKKGLAQITAVFDPDKAKITSATDLMKLKGQVKIHDSFEAMVADATVDAIIIASPNCVHADQVEMAAPSGKAIFLEKPIGSDLAQARRIVHAVRKSGVICQVGLVYRYSPFFRRLAELIHGGLVGDVQLLWCREYVDWIWQPKWREDQLSSGGALVEKNCHHFDIFNWLLKDSIMPETVQAIGGRNIHKGREIIDNAFVNIEYENGVRANLALCLFTKYIGLSFGVVGSKGMIEAKMDGSEVPRRDLITFYPRNHEARDKTEYYIDYEAEFEGCQLRPLGVHGTGLGHSGNVNEVVAFADCANLHVDPICNVEIGLASLYIPVAAEKSIQEGRAVKIKELLD